MPFLQLLLNPAAQDEAAAKSLADVSDLILRYRVVEMTFRDRSARLRVPNDGSMLELIADVQKKITALYSQILEFQIRMACHYSSNSWKRYVRDLITSDDWQGMKKAIDISDSGIKEELDIIADVHLDSVLSEQTSQFQKFSEKAMPLLESLQSSLNRVERTLAEDPSKAEAKQDRLL